MTTKNNNQDNLIDFIKDPKNIEKAVEGSIKDQQSVTDKAREKEGYLPKTKVIEVLDKYLSIQKGDYYEDLTDLSGLLRHRSEDIRKELGL